MIGELVKSEGRPPSPADTSDRQGGVNSLMNYSTGVCQVIFVWEKGVHQRNDNTR